MMLLPRYVGRERRRGMEEKREFVWMMAGIFELFRGYFIVRRMGVGGWNFFFLEGLWFGRLRICSEMVCLKEICYGFNRVKRVHRYVRLCNSYMRQTIKTPFLMVIF